MVSPNTRIMTLQKGTFSLMKRSRISAFHRWSGRRGTLTQASITPKGADVGQKPLEKTQQSCLLVGKRANLQTAYIKMFIFCRGRWWQLGWGKGEKIQGSTLCVKRLLPCFPQLTFRASQMGHWFQLAHSVAKIHTTHSSVSWQFPSIYSLCWL